MKICLDAGHSCPPADTGAVGFLHEDRVTKAVTSRLGKILAKDHEVLITNPRDGSTVTRSLADRCKQSNDFGADLFLSIHCNAFRTTLLPMGTECFASSSIGRNYAVKIEKAIANLGFKSRGVKKNDKLYVIKNTNCPAVLIELFFVDSKFDCGQYALISADGLAKAIAKAI